jgi:hypothetical protein
MGIFKRKQDTSWVYKYELEDFVCKEISIQQYDGINGTWGTKDDKHIIGLFLSGPAFFIYSLDGYVCERYFTDCVSMPYFHSFENVLKRAYLEIHKNKSQVEEKYGRNIPIK